jgi:membrane associated rhomboid family serine protease
LFNNLLSLVLEFSSVSAELGPAWTYALFFGGGIISNVPSFVHERQAGSLGRDLKASAEKFTENWAIQNYIGSIVSKGADWIGRALTPSLSCGSSGAIFTLTGVNFAINLKSAWKRIKKAAESGTVPDAVSAISFIAFKTIMPVAATYACIMGEVNALFGQREALPLSKIIFGQRIAHAAHLQGAIFGMVVGMLV